jgi:hypothetical protein
MNDLIMAMPAVTFIPPEAPELAGPQHSSQRHVQSDCGHYESPQLNRSHSLLRNFSLRSRNSFSLHTRQNQGHCSPPGNVGIDSASASKASGSSLLSVWKKWRVKRITSISQDGEIDAIPAHHHPVSCPPGPARKRSLFLPVGKLTAPFQSSPSDDSPGVIIVSFLPFSGSMNVVIDKHKVQILTFGIFPCIMCSHYLC